ncbi:MAG: D-alanyl-D-alanine carboxypeptidase [Verrucomicrobiaceae bacterium]|nr:D-alanyl-D-alanine carboxypeptidase [Verrucomicrobiaceae bacterium]
MNRLFFSALAALTLLVTSASAIAQSSVIVVDAFNRKVHVAGNANAKRPVGGLAKIATCMVALDWAEASKVGVGVLATVPAYAEMIAGSGSPLGLQAGDSMTLRDLIYATMMGSDNHAAITLGHFIGQDHLARLRRNGQPVDEFVRQMNQLATREGCTGTHFTNPHGVENSRPTPYSTAADMARLAVYAVSRPAMRFYTNQATRSVTIYRAGQQISVTVQNTNQLLGIDRIDGVKTANTAASGGCCVISAEKSPSVTVQADNTSLIYRHRMIVVVLGSGNPFGEARGLLHQGWAAYDRWLAAGRPITDKRQMLADF